MAHVITGRYKRRVKTGSKQGSVLDLWVVSSMSTVAVVPNEPTEYKVELNGNVEKKVRGVWQTIQSFAALGVESTEKSEDEEFQEFKKSGFGKMLVRFFTIVERYHLSLWHLDVLLYFIFLIILTIGESFPLISPDSRHSSRN